MRGSDSTGAGDSQTSCWDQVRFTIDWVWLTRRFFEWDASLVRDGTYYAAMLLARGGGSDADIAVCLQALNVGVVRDIWAYKLQELRWAHAKSWERSQE